MNGRWVGEGDGILTYGRMRYSHTRRGAETWEVCEKTHCQTERYVRRTENRDVERLHVGNSRFDDTTYVGKDRCPKKRETSRDRGVLLFHWLLYHASHQTQKPTTFTENWLLYHASYQIQKPITFTEYCSPHTKIQKPITLFVPVRMMKERKNK